MAEADTQSDSKSDTESEPESDADADSSERCQALTAGGNRCSRPAREDGFCHQHDESDPTVSESETAETDQDAQAETTDPEDVDVDEVEIEVDDSRIEGVLAIRKTVQSTAGELIGHPFDGVSEITATEAGWRAVVEVIERRAVPDTQDIIGRYEIELDEDGVVEGYRRLDRYRRGDTAAFE